MRRYVYAVLVTACVPLYADASVLISEVAWMGSADNANAEWIELYNDGPAEDVTGWTLHATDGQPAIALSGTLSTNGYALLERTSDDTVPGVTAFLVYTGAMGNTGEVLELRDENGALVDRVDGASDWAIGGDNTTKDTLQRSGTPPTGSFITAPATPRNGGGVPPEEKEEEEEEENTNTNTATTTGTVAGTRTSRSASGGNVIYGVQRSDAREYEHLQPALTLLVPDERTVTVRVPTEYVVHAFRESGKEISITDVTWNFGDGTIRSGMTVTHAYEYPGTYIVQVSGERSGFASGVRDTARMTVRAVEPPVIISAATGGYIEVRNTHSTDVDISGYSLSDGVRTFTVPMGTLIAADTKVRFPYASTGIGGGAGTVLYHPTGAVVSVYGEMNTAIREPVVRTQVTAAPKQQFTPETIATGTTPEVDAAMLLTGASYALAAGEETDAGRPLWWWLVGLGAAILATIVTIILVRNEHEPERIAGFEIESDE